MMKCLSRSAAGLAGLAAVAIIPRGYTSPPSKEKLAQAVAERNLDAVSSVLSSLAKNPEEKKAAFEHRNDQHGKPLGTAVANGDVPMVTLLLSHLSDEEVASGYQCPTNTMVADRIAFAEILPSDVNAAVIALRRCSENAKSYDYPCREILDLLAQRDVFDVLRSQSPK